MKKCISMLLALLMMLTIIPTAFADSSYSQPCVVDYFNSFNGFEKQAGTYVTPDGLEKFLQTNWSVANLTSQSDGVNDYLKFSNGSTALMMPFGETIRTGKLHISFDLKIEDYTKLYRFYVYAHDNRKNDNPLDLRNAADTNYNYLNLFDMGITDKTSQKLSLVGNGNKQIDIAEKIKDAWHKYDLEIDFTQTPYKITLAIDGGIRTISTLPYGLKSLYFFYTPGSAAKDEEKAKDPTLDSRNTPIYMDNLFIKHYPSGTYDSTEMTVDYSGSGVANKNALVDVAFSEASSVVNDGGDLMESEFVARNVVDNTETEPITAVKKDSNIRLTFDNLATGTYRIVCKAPKAYQGYFTNGQPSESDTFSTAGTAQNVKEQNILVEDDFENYTGGIPANAEGTGGTKYHTADTLSATTGNGSGTAMNISGKPQQVIYQFPYELTGDKFTYEFDINHADGRWYTGILTADALSGKQSISASLYTKTLGAETSIEPTADQMRSDLMDYKSQINAIGNTGYGDSASNVQYASAKKSTVDKNIDGLSCQTNQWNHVKVEVDLDAATYTVTIGDVTKTVNLDVSRFTNQNRFMKKTVNGEEKWVRTWDYGIKGIALGCYNNDGGAATVNVSFDNLKVYTGNSYNAYQDGDTQGRSDSAIGRAQGWLMQYWPNDSSSVTVTGEGKNYNAETNPNDKAIRIEKLHSQPYAYQFNRPVSASTPFEMEFDIKGDETNTKNELYFRLLTKDQLYSMYENTPTDGAVAESFVDHNISANDKREKGLCNITSNSATTEEPKVYNSSVIFGARTATGGDGKTGIRIVHDNGLHRRAAADSTWLTEDDGEIPFDIDNKWVHVKLSGYPKNGKMTFVLSITDANGNTKTSKELSTSMSITTEFAAFGIGPVTSAMATQIVYLDNFTVKETNPVSKAYVTGVNAVDVSTGERANLKSDGLRTNGDSIEISFSEPISEDTISNIKIYQGNPVKYISTTATLSTDKKTVTLTPKSIPTVGEKYMLEIPQTVKTAAASNLSIVKPKAVAFTINNKTGTAELKVEDFRLYKYYEAGANESVVYAANWVPVADTELKDLTTDDKFKFIAKGYNTNTGDPIKLWLGRAEKDPTTTLLTNFDNQTADAPYGKFEVALPEFTMEDANGSLETYLWESAGLRPLCGKYVFSVTKTPTEATE